MGIRSFGPGSSALLGELFTSVQGEGLRVGVPMTFIRFLGCNLSCGYCDTPAARLRDKPFQAEGRSYRNPVDLADIPGLVSESEVALTGGEPLLQPEAVFTLATALKKAGRSVYLETNGTLAENMARVVPVVDWVAMDIKVPSATGQTTDWDIAGRFLSIARRSRVFVKAVMDGSIRPDEIDRIGSVIRAVDPEIPLVIQPVFGRPMPAVLEIQQTLRKMIVDVRIIPQVHKLLGLR